MCSVDDMRINFIHTFMRCSDLIKKMLTFSIFHFFFLWKYDLTLVVIVLGFALINLNIVESNHRFCDQCITIIKIRLDRYVAAEMKDGV